MLPGWLTSLWAVLWGAAQQQSKTVQIATQSGCINYARQFSEQVQSDFDAYVNTLILWVSDGETGEPILAPYGRRQAWINHQLIVAIWALAGLKSCSGLP